MKKDIKNRKDIQLLIDNFYKKLLSDKTIGYIFTDIVKINLEKHLPIMYDFWDNALFYSGTYTGNPMNLHRHLNNIQPLEKIHFDKWIELFEDTVSNQFDGEKANQAIKIAKNIAVFLQEMVGNTKAAVKT